MWFFSQDFLNSESFIAVPAMKPDARSCAAKSTLSSLHDGQISVEIFPDFKENVMVFCINSVVPVNP